MVEAPRSMVIKEVPFSVGDVVLVLRDVGDPELEGRDEEGGIVYEIEQSGRVFIDYGGVVSLLHDEDQIRPAPEDIREALAMRLNQNSEELHQEMLKATSGIRSALEEYHKTDTFFKWLAKSIKSRFGKNEN